jgi:hypothetical protein
MEQNLPLEASPSDRENAPGFQTVGSSLPRVAALAKGTGKARDPGDFHFAAQLTMKVVFAHRRMQRACYHLEEAGGAWRVMIQMRGRAKQRIWPGTMDQPVLCGPGSSKLILITCVLK